MRRRRRARRARRAASVGGPVAIGAGWLSAAAVWGGETHPKALFERRILPDLGNGPAPLAAAIVASAAARSSSAAAWVTQSAPGIPSRIE